jgi:hypothetical protein
MLQLTSANLVGGAVKPTTDALKQATDRLLKEQQVALQKADLFKSKLAESSVYTARLEKAYQDVVRNNSGLRAKVAADNSFVQDLSARFDAQNHALATLEKRVCSLSKELSSTETEREQLLKSRCDAESVVKKLFEEVSETTGEVQTLRNDLSEGRFFSAGCLLASREKSSAEKPRAAFLRQNPICSIFLAEISRRTTLEAQLKASNEELVSTLCFAFLGGRALAKHAFLLLLLTELPLFSSFSLLLSLAGCSQNFCRTAGSSFVFFSRGDQSRALGR